MNMRAPGTEKCHKHNKSTGGRAKRTHGSSPGRTKLCCSWVSKQWATCRAALIRSSSCSHLLFPTIPDLHMPWQGCACEAAGSQQRAVTLGGFNAQHECLARRADSQKLRVAVLDVCEPYAGNRMRRGVRLTLAWCTPACSARPSGLRHGLWSGCRRAPREPR